MSANCANHEAQVVRMEGLVRRVDGVEQTLYNPEYGLVHRVNSMLSSQKTLLAVILFVQPVIFWALNKYAK